ncbi:MAG: hypothetical protein IJR92_01305 [Alphaproteobacteria bacterium]|nr:hypothetical protein [Alphaproteobacteria bacterium]
MSEKKLTKEIAEALLTIIIGCVVLGLPALPLYMSIFSESHKTPMDPKKKAKEIVAKIEKDFYNDVYDIRDYVYDSVFCELKEKNLGEKPVLDTNASRMNAFVDAVGHEVISLDNNMVNTIWRNGLVWPKYRWRIHSIEPYVYSTGDSVIEWGYVYGDDKGVDAAFHSTLGKSYNWEAGYIVDSVEDISSKIKKAVAVRDSLLSVYENYKQDRKAYKAKEDSLSHVAFHQHALPVEDSLLKRFNHFDTCKMNAEKNIFAKQVRYKADIIRNRNRH